MPNSNERSKVTLKDPSGEARTVEVGSGTPVTCPECGSENGTGHTLDNVIAGECYTCFHVWRIGVQTDIEVVGDAE